MIKFIKILSLLSFYIYSLPLCAGTQNNPEVAKKILNSDSLIIKNETMSYCVYAPSNGIGYVIVTKNEEQSIIGYSKESIWNEDDFPTVLLDWLHFYNDSYKCHPICQSSHKAKQDITNKKKSVEPLLSTTWHQQSPYNNYAPVIEDGNVKTVAGCVAVAAAQITYYWWRDNPSATLKNTPVYPYGGAPITVSIPQGTPNEWELIKDKYDESDTKESKDAVARLCYVIGTTSYLDYATSTGGQIRDAANAIYSQYNLAYEYLSRKNFEIDDWKNLLYEELSCNRPVLCSGTGNGGHAFVLDGYDNETGLFHFNFGWGGSGDGYYPIDDSELSMGGYYMNQSIVYNIHPMRRNIDANISVSQIENNCYNIKIKIHNMGTLPALIKLVHGDNDEIINADCDCLWESIVNNNNEPHLENIIVNDEELKSNPTLLLIDEYDSLLSKYKFDTNGISPIYTYGENLNNRFVGIDGKSYKSVTSKGLFIVNDNNSIKKILVR